MSVKSIVVFNAFLAALTAAAPSQMQMEGGLFAQTTARWIRGERCKPGQTIDVTVQMKKSASQMRELETLFWAVSDTTSSKYGQHVDAKAITDIVGASQDSIDVVARWLTYGGASSVRVHPMKDSMQVTMPCVSAEAMFNTEIHTFKNAKHTLLRASKSYHLPVEIASVVSMIGDLISLPKLNTPTVVENTDNSGVTSFPPDLTCNDKCGLGNFVTPAVITKAYNMGPSPQSAKGSMAVAEFQGISWDQADCDKFSSTCSIVPPINVSHQDGPNNGGKCRVPIVGVELCGEAMLDIEYIGALGGAIPLTNVYIAQFSLLKWAQTVLAMPSSTMPLVNSVSYGNDEAQQTSKEYMEEVNAEFMKFGAVGATILFASGDQGVVGREGGRGRYHPDFPASSPYVTAVGGTDFVTKSTIGPEKAWTQGGGGFSDTFPRPAFQFSAVSDYLTSAGSNLPDQAKWNNTGRAYPDVSALGGQVNPYCVHVGGMFNGVAGTSAACPVFASVVAKLNEIRLANGGSPLGYMNPWIYQNASKGFNDVTQGRNCGQPVCRDTDGFPAIAGWDAATGWGTPNFEMLKTFL